MTEIEKVAGTGVKFFGWIMKVTLIACVAPAIMYIVGENLDEAWENSPAGFWVLFVVYGSIIVGWLAGLPILLMEKCLMKRGMLSKWGVVVLFLFMAVAALAGVFFMVTEIFEIS